MTIFFNKEHESLKSEILKVISNFDSYNNSFDTGKRNSIKKIQIKNKTYVVKSFKKPHLINQFVYKYLRKSKAKRSFEYAGAISNLGINTPEPICYIENSTFFGLKDSYYISEFIDYNLTFYNLIIDANYPNRDKIVEAFTKFTYELHEKGILFLDHSSRNTLIVTKENDYEFYLVDLNRMVFKELTFNDRLKNFARLTRNKELIKKMSYTYAQLINKKPNEVYEGMWFYNLKFQKKFDGRKHFKQKFLNRKK